FDTTGVPDGLYDLRVVATDARGDIVASAPRRAVQVDNTPPLVTLADPGTPLHGQVTLDASAGDANGSGVASVPFQRAAAGTEAWDHVATLTDAPYRVSFDSSLLENGDYDFRAVATDGTGNVTASVVSGRSIDNPPGSGPPRGTIVTSLAPAHG